MIATADQTPYGSYAPGPFARTMLAMTRRLPANWVGLRTSMPLRRLAINSLGDRPVDTVIWNSRVRLYPSRNSCEKNALFTPQMFDLIELGALATAIDQRVAAGEPFTFVDIGANVGLYSLYVASRGGPLARILAVEPQPGIVERLRFNVRANSGFNIVVLPMAVADRDGDVELVINERDNGGTHLRRNAAPGGPAVRVPCRPLAAMLKLAGILSINAMKIDIEGAEHLALAPFLREEPGPLLPRLVLIEDRPQDWSVDLYALLRERGYAIAARTRQNVVLGLATVERLS
jgi:FkbM family methyltransferase